MRSCAPCRISRCHCRQLRPPLRLWLCLALRRHRGPTYLGCILRSGTRTGRRRPIRTILKMCVGLILDLLHPTTFATILTWHLLVHPDGE
jgi:hypothetical protein